MNPRTNPKQQQRDSGFAAAATATAAAAAAAAAGNEPSSFPSFLLSPMMMTTSSAPTPTPTTATAATGLGGGDGGGIPMYEDPNDDPFNRNTINNSNYHANNDDAFQNRNNDDDSFTAASIGAVWDARVACLDFQRAVAILTERGLKLAAKWAAEQWMGLPPEIILECSEYNEYEENNNNNNSGVVQSTISNDLFLHRRNNRNKKNYYNNNNTPALSYARTLMELGEYAHAAAVLSVTSLTHRAPTVEKQYHSSAFHTTTTGSNTATGGTSTNNNNANNNNNTNTNNATMTHNAAMPPPLPDLSPAAIFARAYALYMAGERAKEEQALDAQSEGNKQAFSRNPYLPQLAQELLQAYESNRLDAFGLHVYGMVLSSSIDGHVADATTSANLLVLLPPRSPPAHLVLIQSILQFPYNWSAWLDLSRLVMNSSSSSSLSGETHPHQASTHNNLHNVVEGDIEDLLQPVLASHCMYHFFCAHLLAERQSHAEALVILEQWMDPTLFGGSPYLLGQHAVCSYHIRDFASAKSLMQDLHNHMPYRLDCMDVYSNILYVQEDSVALSQLAHAAVQVDKYRAETCCIVGNYYSLKQQRAKAIQYFQRALKMDRTFTSAWTLMGHEYVEWKQTANAMESYRRAVQICPTDYRAWYGLGQTYELLNMNLYALYYYQRAAHLRPYDARMWCAVGSTYILLSRPSDAIRALERAVDAAHPDDAQGGGVATQKLAALYRQDGNTEMAAQCYMRHLEMRSHPGHPNATGAAGSATIEKMLLGVVVESTEAEALLFLANYYRENADYETSTVFCSRLLDYPGPERDQAKALLRELRSRLTATTTSMANRGPSTRFTAIHTRSKGPVQDSEDYPPE